MSEKIEVYLDKYYDIFDEPFPLMQSSENEIESEILECLKRKKRAPELWPSKYGSANGKVI